SVTYSWCRVSPGTMSEGRSAFLADDLCLCSSVFVNGIVFFVTWLDAVFAIGKERRLEVGHFTNKCVFEFVVDHAGLGDIWQRNVVQTPVLQELFFKSQHICYRDIIQVASRT